MFILSLLFPLGDQRESHDSKEKMHCDWEGLGSFYSLCDGKFAMINTNTRINATQRN